MTWPHDDTASLTAFYGPPGTPANMVLVVPPWPMTYAGRPIRGVQIHRKCADSLKAVFDDIARQVGHDWSKLPPGAVKFSGSYNFRPIRGSSRASCHAFGAAIDLDADANEMNTHGGKGTMSSIVIGAFKREGWYWGGDFHSRQDPMHFQAANETSRVAELESDLDPVSSAQAAEMPPMTDGHDDAAHEAALPQSSIEELPGYDPGGGEISRRWPEAAGLKSKITWAQAVLGFFGIGGVGAQADASTFAKAKDFFTSPGFLLLVIVACIGLTIYWRWRDHGRGQING